ncbi:hypothetical protein DMC30DRAFT_448640 [Rhodotorula diobovata]|uniref:BAG domain-containing protein n=1 Tax=Rhodotorula diobovata TaxID=5288 RepID=A0A5C5FRS0_9BASI|nr:hypothetical protein DMC30DRAFT_448640 [Rhodotorula diobovata]
MFAFPTYQQRHPHDQARATYEREVERLAFLTQEHERQRRRAAAAAHQAAVAAYVEEQERRQRQAAFEHAVQLEVERRRREEQQARLVIEAALARRRAQEQEREAALPHRQAILEAAQRRAVLIAREQHRLRLEAEQDQRRRVVEARRQQQQQQQRTRQAQLPQALFQLFLDLASSSEPEEQRQQGEQRPVVEAPPTVKPAPSPAPAVPSTAAAEPALSDPAAEAIQRRFERNVARQAALDTLNRLTSDLDARLSSFSAPASLTFQSSSTSPSTSTPPLAFGKPNSSFLGHEDFLVSLLSKIDAVSSGGDKVIKQARKDLVKREHEWERQSQRAASEAGDRDTEHAAEAPSPAANVESAPPVDQVPKLADSSSTEASAVASSSSEVKAPVDESNPVPSPPAGEPVAAAPSSSSMNATAEPARPSADAIGNDPVPLTVDAIAALSYSTPDAPADPASAVPRPPSRASTSSLASEASSTINGYVDEVLRRARELGERIDAEEEAERAVSAGKVGRESTIEARESAAPEVKHVEDVERDAQAPQQSSDPLLEASEPREDGDEEEIDVEATLRRMRQAQPVEEITAADSMVPSDEEKKAEGGKEAGEDQGDAASEAGTEEFLVV